MSDSARDSTIFTDAPVFCVSPRSSAAPGAFSEGLLDAPGVPS